MSSPVSRRPAVAGFCYPADPQELRTTLEAFVPEPPAQRSVIAAVTPHGSLRQSGGVAAAVFAGIVIPRRCILIGPSHTGTALRWSVMAAGAYRTPLGEAPVDEAFAAGLQRRCAFLETDGLHQLGEHSLEVQLPFLQALRPELSIVPVVTQSADPDQWEAFGEALAAGIREAADASLIVATADFSQFAPADRAEAQSRLLAEACRRLDGRWLAAVAAEHGIRSCGLPALACALEAARRLGGGAFEVVGWSTSAATGGDPDSASGYIGAVIT